MLKALIPAAIVASSQSAPPPSGIDVSIWKWVIIIGVATVTIVYAVWRISQVVVNKKTDNISRDVVGDDDPGESE